MRRPTAVLAIAALAAVPLLGTAGTASAHPAHGPVPKKGQQSVTAYYVHDNGRALHLVAERRVVARTTGVARAAVTEALRAPHHPRLDALAPRGTRVLGVSLRRGVLTVDLSREVRRNPGVGAAGELAFAQQLAHSAGQYPDIDAVRLRVGGRPVTTLWGHLDWSVPVRPDTSLIAD